MRQIFRFIAVILFGLLLTSCTTTNEKKHTPQKEVEVSILMPLSGPNAELGKRLAELIRIGIEDKLSGLVNLTMYDVATPEITADTMLKVIDKKSQIILGPLYSSTATQIAPLARAHGITVVTMSNNPLLASEGIFVFGHAPMKQTQRLFGYLLHEQYKDYVLLLPANKTSQNLIKVLESLIIANNAHLMATELYVDTPESIGVAVEKVAQKIDELNEDVSREKKVVVYVADDPSVMPNLFGAFQKHYLDKKAIICGDNRIDVDFPHPISLLYTGSLNAYNSNLGAWLLQTYGTEHLSYIETMAYDLGGLIANAIGTSYDKNIFLDRLKGNVWYHGTSGKLRFNDMITERLYDIVKRDGVSYHTVDKGSLGTDEIGE